MARKLDLSKIGGSDLHAILGMSSYLTPSALAKRLQTGEQESGGDAMARAGLALEGWLRTEYEIRFGVKVLPVEGRVGDWWRASPDGVVEGTDVGVELKAWDPIRRREFGEPDTDEVPVQLMVQCQWYMRWFGWRAMDAVVSFGTRDPEVYHLTSNPSLQARLERLGRTFWERARSTDPLLIPAVQQPAPERTVFLDRDQVLPDYGVTAKVRYMIKTNRLKKRLEEREKIMKAWAAQAVGNQPGRIVTNDGDVLVYNSKYGLSVRVTERK